MILRGTIVFATAASLLLAGGGLSARADSTNAPDFKEVYQLLLAHLPGATDDALNQTAVAGLLAQLPGRAEILGDTAPAGNLPPVKAAIIDQSVAYLRVSRVNDTLSARLAEANQLLAASNKLAGTVVDLRFATGDAYDTVKTAADLLAAPKTPVIVLVNAATSGAAEVLAAELRDSGGLILGSPTAGLAMRMQDFPLANGERLRIATTPVQFHGADLTRLQPDIFVKTGLDEDRSYLSQPYEPLNTAKAGADTNSLVELLDHTTEADLVRQKRKDGDSDENPEPPVKTEPARLVLRDPVLARAVDLVQALAVIRLNHD